jgi:hypothetical protein
MRNKIILITGLVASAFFLNSCLKDKIGEDWTAALKGKMYAEIEFPGFWAHTIGPDAGEQLYSFIVNIDSDVPPSSDMTITVASDPAALATYNAAQFAKDTTFVAYKIFPSFSISNATATIKAGSRNTRVTVIMTRADTLNLSNKYCVPISITGASAGVTIAANKKTILIGVPIANQWEGDYQADGRLHKETAWDRTFSMVKHLSTLDATSVSYPAFDIGLDTKITIDPVTYEVTALEDLTGTYTFTMNTAVENFDGQGGDSHYDPATKTFYLYYYYVGSGNLHRTGHEVLVRQ